MEVVKANNNETAMQTEEKVLQANGTYTPAEVNIIHDKSAKEAYYELENYITQLETNWKELKKWLEDYWKESQDIWFVKIINKMQELEQGKDENKL